MTVNAQPKKVRLPSKRTINLASVNETNINLKIMIPAIIIVAAIAIGFAKFFVIDFYVKEAKAKKEVSDIQSQINDGYDRIAEFGDLVDLYAHYTYADMTEEELALVDRSQIISVMDRVLAAKLIIDQWTIRGNNLQVFVYGKTLQEINEISHSLYDDPSVEFCEVKTASTDINEMIRDERLKDLVYAQITVSFVPASDPLAKEVTEG